MADVEIGAIRRMLASSPPPAGLTEGASASTPPAAGNPLPVDAGQATDAIGVADHPSTPLIQKPHLMELSADDLNGIDPGRRGNPAR